MVSPRTLNTRPSVSFPTGTLIEEPVSTTVAPRFKPSEESMAIVRMMPSPNSRATSITNCVPLSSSTVKALLISGKDSLRGNCTSTTGPIT